MEHKIGFLFPGQGSQKISMGYDLLGSETFKNMEDRGIPIRNILNDEKLLNDKAAYAIYAVSLTLAQELKKKGVIPHSLLGFSLGEITALSFSEILDTNDSIELLIKRTEAMEKECLKHSGKMVSILGIGIDEIKELIKGSKLYCANLNSEFQTVISGSSEDIDEFLEKLKGIKHVVLNVNGAFHSPYMENVGNDLKDFFKDKSLSMPKYKVMSNYVGDYHEEDINLIKNNIIKQVYSPVRFMDMVKKAYDLGVDTFIEVGEGKTMTNLVKRILDKDKIRTFNVRNLADVEEISNIINGELEK